MPEDSIVTVVKDTVFIKDTIFRTEIITVYKDTIQQTELTTLYQTVLQNQSSNYTTLITTLLVITGALLGATWLWNFFYAEKKIQREVEDSIEAVRKDTEDKLEKSIDHKFETLEKTLTAKIEQKDKEVQEKFSTTEKQFDEKFGRLTSAVNKGLIKNEAEIARNFAASTLDSKEYTASLAWWIIALRKYVKLDNTSMTRLCVDSILEIVSIENWNSNPYDEFDISKEIERVEELVPALLEKEKREIIKLLKAKI